MPYVRSGSVRLGLARSGSLCRALLGLAVLARKLVQGSQALLLRRGRRRGPMPRHALHTIKLSGKARLRRGQGARRRRRGDGRRARRMPLRG